MLLRFTVFVSKLARTVSRLTGRGGGSALPGLIAEKLDSNALAKLARNLPGGAIIVTGTNGKTTTTKMLAAIVEAEGKRVLTNRSGSNLTRGILSTLIDQASLSGKLDFDLGLFEVDEATMPAACEALKPKLIVVTNLFRDQLDRYGELDKTADLIGRGIETAAIAQVWLNSDDPLVANLVKYAGPRAKFFGVEHSDVKKLLHDQAADSSHCPNDGIALEYSQAFFSHIGHYKCPKGDFERPRPEVALRQSADRSSLIANRQSEGREATGELRLKLPGLYNAYNALAAVSAATSLGVDLRSAVAAVNGVSAAFGRVETVEVEGRKLMLLLIKNPTGFNQVIQTFLADGQPKPLLMLINDNFADGRDVSWLWDVAFEEITDLATNGRRKTEAGDRMGQSVTPSTDLRPPVIASGVRAADLALRLKYADIEATVETDMSTALNDLLTATPAGGTAYVLPTYTAMFELRQLLAKKVELKEFYS